MPKLNYSCRNQTQYVSLTEEIDVIDKYVEHLKDKGLTDDEIKRILKKIQIDAICGIKPKVEELNDVYNAIKTS